MPCLSGSFIPAIGPLLNVGIAPPTAPGQVPPGQVKSFPALIDTGASSTCISAAVAQAVGLQPIGMRPMASATQSVPVNVYLGTLIVPFGPTSFLIGPMQLMEFNPVAVLQPGEGASPASPFEILLGRDVLCRGAFALSFDGHFTLSL